jgi:hypothetical protein
VCRNAIDINKNIQAPAQCAGAFLITVYGKN